MSATDYRLGKLKGGFVVVWYENGRRHRWRLGATSAAGARAALRNFTEERDRLLGSQKQGTVAKIWASYVADRKEAGKVALTRMVDAWKRLAPYFAELIPTDIDSPLVRDYTGQRRRSGASDGTIHTELGYLRAALHRALKDEAPYIPLPPKPRPRGRSPNTWGTIPR